MKARHRDLPNPWKTVFRCTSRFYKDLLALGSQTTIVGMISITMLNTGDETQ